MPGGNAEAWPTLNRSSSPLLLKLPTRSLVGDWVGEGAQATLKMVHNGIEGDMQLISEAYRLYEGRPGHELPGDAGGLCKLEYHGAESYLIEITANILGMKDDQPGRKASPA